MEFFYEFSCKSNKSWKTEQIIYVTSPRHQINLKLFRERELRQKYHIHLTSEMKYKTLLS